MALAELDGCTFAPNLPRAGVVPRPTAVVHVRDRKPRRRSGLRKDTSGSGSGPGGSREDEDAIDEAKAAEDGSEATGGRKRAASASADAANQTFNQTANAANQTSVPFLCRVAACQELKRTRIAKKVGPLQRLPL